MSRTTTASVPGLPAIVAAAGLAGGDGATRVARSRCGRLRLAVLRAGV